MSDDSLTGDKHDFLAGRLNQRILKLAHQLEQIRELTDRFQRGACHCALGREYADAVQAVLDR